MEGVSMKRTLCLVVGFFAVGGILFFGCSNQPPLSISMNQNGGQHTEAAAIVENKWYNIIPSCDISKFLDVSLFGGVQNGSQVKVFDQTHTYDQQWQFVPLNSDGPNVYRIVNRYNPNLCLDADVLPGPVGNGTKVQLWEYCGTSNQKWKVESIPGSYPVFKISPLINSNLVLDIDWTNARQYTWFPNGAKAQLWAATGTWNQAFYLN
jgi:hypothetical protein